MAWGLIGAAPAAAATVPFTTTGCTHWTVPANVSGVAVTATGAPGAPGTSGASGGSADQVSGTIAVTAGQVLDVCVGVGGGAGGSGSNPGGAGGGASGVSSGSSFSNPLLVAAGGGGGGGGGGSLAGAGGGPGVAGTKGTGNGGAAGTGNGAGGNGSSFGAGGPGAGGPGGSGGGAGGGGGAGYNGGGGGAGSSIGGGGGGGGGADYCNANGCSTQTAGGAPQVTLSYTAASSPVASIAAPMSGSVYTLNQVVDSSFSCTEGANGSGISSCTDQSGHASGAPIDTSSAGSHTFTVTALSGDGMSSSSSVTYTVAAPPVVWLPLPSSGAVYWVGQTVSSWFLCGEGTGGPGLASCLDQSGRASGAPVDTSAAGTHTFTVTATSKDGEVTTTSSTYTVVPLPAVSHVAAHPGGAVSLDVTVYGAGAIDVLETAGLRSFALAADVIHPPKGSFVFGHAHVVSAGPQTLHVTVPQSQLGRLLLRDHRTAAVRLWVVYTVPTGPAILVKSLVVQIAR